MNLPINDVDAVYAQGQLWLRPASNGVRSTVLMLHATLPTIWFDEVLQRWRTLDGHVSEIEHGR